MSKAAKLIKRKQQITLLIITCQNVRKFSLVISNIVDRQTTKSLFIPQNIFCSA